jgi:hypothetical protein
VNEGRNIIVQALAKAGSRRGFKGVRDTNFYRERPETICLLNLQKSSWGPQFYINAAVWFTRFGPDRRPKEHHCHIRWRVDSLMQDQASKLFVQALDLETPMPGDYRLSLIENGVDAYGFGLLSRCESEHSALRVADENGPHVMVLLKARGQQEAM